MKHVSCKLLAIGLVAATASTGCSQAEPPRFAAATIPLGKWQGRGTFLAYEGISENKDDPSPRQRYQDGVYETTLEIGKQTVVGQEAIVIEIRSERGRIFESDNSETRLKALLLPLKTTTHANTAYALGMLEYNPKEWADYRKNEAQIRAKSDLPSASCVQIGQQTCLQIHYLMPEGDSRWMFKDSLVFSRDDVLKTGSFAVTGVEAKNGQKPEHKTTQAYWVERLRRAQ
ncbi:MAG: hypothetical protein JXQ73_21485 [Phycisphaerae bacterium]|nr:hypothetical protein [Phycisphaerae bacterium]